MTFNDRGWLGRVFLVSSIALLPARVFSAEVNESESAIELEASAIDARLVGSIQYLAGNELRGRGVGTEGIDLAADYLAEEFRSAGLRVDWFGGSPFQEFKMTDRAKLGPTEKNRLALRWEPSDTNGEARLIELTLEEQFTPMAIGKSGELNHELVFVGYGITAERLGYDDYAGVDVEDKVVVMLRKEPQQNEADSRFDGKRSSSHATFRRKIANAVDHGAAAVLMVNDRVGLRAEMARQRKRLAANIGRLERLQEDFARRDQPSQQQEQDYIERVGKLAKRIVESSSRLENGAFDEVVRFNHAGSRSLGAIPVFFATRSAIEPVIELALGSTLADLEEAIDEDLMPRSGPLAGWRVEAQADIVAEKISIKNVVAVLEGEGPLADETIIVGAHYDHLGMGGRGTLAPWTREIHNGADDNASGTAALVEVARRMAWRDKGPRRRIVFIAFTGEERGLLGSKHYVRSPRFPLDKTIAMINMDMVGRLKHDRLTIYGTGTASEFEALVDGLNEAHGFRIDKVATGYGPSDHASFYGAGIPVLFLFTGLHKDYHRPSDDWDKINIEGVRRVVDLVVDLINAIDAEDEPPTFQKTKRQPFRRGNPDRAYLGIMPDMMVGDEGVTVQQVVDSGPAAAAGMQEGDVILKIGDEKIDSFATLGEALSKFKPKDKVEVVVQRGAEQLTLDVTLGSP